MQGKKNMANRTWERIQRELKGFKLGDKNSWWQSKEDFGCLTVPSALSIKPFFLLMDFGSNPHCTI